MFKSLFQMAKRLVKGYSYTKHEHCNDPKLLALIDDFKNYKFDKVEETLLNFSDDYRDFGFNSLGEVSDINIINRWISEDPNNITAQIVLAYHKVIQAWIIRGIGSIDSVEESDMQRFKTLLHEAKDILDNLKDTPSEFDIQKDICLLTLYKAINLEDRTLIHKTFQHGLHIAPKSIGLHIAYFIAISEKWGGTREELDSYLNQVPDEPKLLNQCIQTLYFWDLIRVYQIDDKRVENQITAYIRQLDQEGIEKNNLYRYNLYLRMYWLSSVLAEDLEDKYYNLVKPHFDDK